jgi:L-amino acid N-acyltransferase YncA
VEQYNIREAAEKDIKAIFDLSNTPNVRNASFRSAPLSWEEHVAWFYRVLANPECIFLVADNAGQIGGQIRLNREDAQTVVSISVDPGFQGLGIGSSLYRAALAEARKKWPLAEVVARIKKTNSASITFFKKLGFIPASEELICGEQALVMVSTTKDEKK